MAKELLQFETKTTKTKSDYFSFIFRQIEKVNTNAKNEQFKLSFLNTKSQLMLF
jgi:hypothetical protein